MSVKDSVEQRELDWSHFLKDEKPYYSFSLISFSFALHHVNAETLRANTRVCKSFRMLQITVLLERIIYIAD